MVASSAVPCVTAVLQVTMLDLTAAEALAVTFRDRHCADVFADARFRDLVDIHAKLLGPRNARRPPLFR